MSFLMIDLRHALRSLARSPAFVALALLCLVIGIGATTTVFSLVNSLLLQPMPFAESERLVVIGESPRESPGAAARTSQPAFLDLRVQGERVAEMGAVRLRDASLAEDDRVARVDAAFASSNFLPLLSLEPIVGRGLRDDDTRTGAAPVVLLSETLWRQRFAADPALIGQSIRIDGNAHTVVGIVPKLVHPTIPAGLRAARLWLPLTTDVDAGREVRSLLAVGRLRPDMPLEVARARLDALGNELARLHPAHEGWTITVQPLAHTFSSSTRTMLLLTMGAVAFVLLIACANVANLMLARATARRREIAIRRALGASRGRIVRLLLTESSMVGLAAVPFGLLLASWSLNVLERAESGAPGNIEIPIDARVLAFTIAIAVVTSLIFGLAPALHAVRGATREALAGSGTGSSDGRLQKRMRDALVVAEVAMSVVLLVGASLFVRSLLHQLALETGFDTSRVAVLRVTVPADRTSSPEALVARVEEVVDRVAGVHGIDAAGASDLLPLRGGGSRTPVILDGTGVAAGRSPVVVAAGITSRWFESLNVPVLRGRGFTPSEARRVSYVAVINERMAAQLWPDQDALGRRFRLAGDTSSQWFGVIGIVRDLPTWDLSNRPMPTAYLPFAHAPVHDPRLVIRTRGDPLATIASVQSAVRALDPSLEFAEGTSMDDVHRSAFWRQRMLGGTLSVFGIVAILLAAVGLYGVLAYLVSHRTREIGIRMALGAERRDVIRLVLRQGLGLVLGGMIIGVPLALAAARVARGQLHGVTPTDLVSFAGVALLLGGVGLIASYVPARRAAGVSPAISMRE